MNLQTSKDISSYSTTLDRTRLMVVTALFTALTCIFTMAIKIDVPMTSGYIHPGDSMVFLSAIFLPWPYGIFAAGVGSMLADILLGYGIWAPPTLIIKSLMAFVLWYTVRQQNKKSFQIALLGVGSVVWIGFMMALLGLSGNLADPDAGMPLARYFLMAFAVTVPVVLVLFYAIARKRQHLAATFTGMVLAGLIMMIGYYTAASLIYGDFIAPILSLPMNMVQFIAGLLIASALTPVLKLALKHIR